MIENTGVPCEESLRMPMGNSESSVVLSGRGVVKWVGSKQYVIGFFDL